MTAVEQSLRRSGLRVTPARQAILQALAKARRPMSADRVWENLRTGGVDRVTVYRSMDTLMNAGLIRSVDLDHGHRDYELNMPGNHHHHLVCKNCGTIADVDVAGEDRLIEQVGRRHGFLPQSHSLEIFGRCAECQ